MKKFLAFFLALCMMMGALPVLAEAGNEKAGSILTDLIAGLTGGEGSNSSELSALLELISSLKEKHKGSEARIQAALSALKPKFEKLLKSGEKGLGSVLSGLKEKLNGGADFDLEGILNSLLGCGDSGLSEEEIEEFNNDIEKMNQEALAETGDSVPGKKEAGSMEEFYGNWTYSKYVFGDQEFDMSDSGGGIFIGDNTYYITTDGEMDTDDGVPPEVLEMKLDNGVLKILINRLWGVFVLTENNELVMVSGGSLSYYVRAE